MLRNLALASKLGFVCLLLAVASASARTVSFDHGLSSPLRAFDDPLMGLDSLNSTHKRDSNQFIMTGYQSTFFRSSDCNISLPIAKEPYTLTVVNWYAMYWAFEGKNLEKMHMVIEAETRGWVGVAFGGASSNEASPPEAVFGWIQKSDSGAAHDISHVGSHLLTSGWEGVMSPGNENSKKIPLESASVCQTRDGRTILRFTRKSHAGYHPIRTTSGSYQIAHMAIGRFDTPSSPLEATRLSWSPLQSRVDVETESDFWTKIYHALLIIFHVFSWFIR